MKSFRLLAIVLLFGMVFSFIAPSLNTQPAVSAQAGVQARVGSDNLNVRESYGFGARVIGQYNTSVTLELQGREDLLGNGGIWVYGTPVGGGTTGWVLSDYLIFPAGFNVESLPIINAQGTPAGEGAGVVPPGGGEGQTAAAVNFRTQPSLVATIIRTLPSGTAFTPIGRTGDGRWVKANVGGTEGWLYYTLVLIPQGVSSLPVADGSTPAAPPSVPAGEVPAGSLSGSTTSAVNFRTGPGLGFSIITTLASGRFVYFTGRSGDNAWFRANVDGTEGWLYYTLINISGDRNSLPVVAGDPGGGGAGTPPPAYSGANLSVFSYGAHVAGFNRPDLMSYAGMTWAKVQVRYGRGADPNGVAGLINDAHAKGFRILLGVVGHPNDVLGGQAYYDEYANYVAGLARLGADAIEIWNEQNLDREWAHGHLDPAQYTQLLATSYNAIKGANPSTIVISGALAPTGAEGAFGRAAVWNDNAYLAGMRSAGAANYMDCLGAHYNEGIVSPYQTTGDPRDNYYTRYFYGMINTYASIINKPICFTELGYLSPEGFGGLPGHFSWASNVTVAQHAQWVADAVRLGRSNGRVKLIIIWNMDFQGSPGGDPMGGYALIRPDGSCPACDRLAGR